MYCDEQKLSSISRQIVGLTLRGIYPDWRNKLIYLHFADSCRTVLISINNNYYAGLEILQHVDDSDFMEPNENCIIHR